MDLDFNFGISSTTPKTFDENESHQKKLKKLQKHDQYPEILAICKHYVQNFIPSPIEHENEYWMISTFPGNYATPIRLNIYWHEVMNIRYGEEQIEGQDNLEVMIFIDNDYITVETIQTLQTETPGCRFDPDYSYEKGLETQLAVFVPLGSYSKLVDNDSIYEATRQYNHRLSLKGRRVHSGHNFYLARLLFEK